MNEIIELMNLEIESIMQKHMEDIILQSDSLCANALKEIQQVIKAGNIVGDNKSDFEMIEDIVCIFEKYQLNTGGCHDFG